MESFTGWNHLGVQYVCLVHFPMSETMSIVKIVRLEHIRIYRVRQFAIHARREKVNLRQDRVHVIFVSQGKEA
jgi:hypothetical protein